MDTVKFVNSNHRVNEAHNGPLHEKDGSHSWPITI